MAIMIKKPWHSFSIKKVIESLGTDSEKGLSADDVIIRRNKWGKNELPQEKPLSGLKTFLEQFQSPLVYILIIAGVISLFFKLYTDCAVIFAAIILDTSVGFFQEKKASKALSALKKVVKVDARVIRQSREIKIDAQEIVPGDVVVLNAGDKVPADCRLIWSRNLKINEAPLTGEWRLAEKSVKILPKETPLADRDNMAYMGCIIETGQGKAVVTEIGKNSQVGKIAAMVRETREEKTPIQKKISVFSKKIGIIIAVLCAFIFFGGIIRGQPGLEMFITAIAIAVAAIPEGLPVAFTVILSLGMTRILKKKGLVRKLISAETLGSTSVIASDKTLTLTQGKMKVSEIVTAKNQISEERTAMRIAVLCSEAFVENPQDIHPLWRVQGKPTDKAFVLAGAEVGLNKSDLEKEFPILDEVPFESKNKFILNLRSFPKKKNVLHISGAPEKILSLSNYFEINGKKRKLNKRDREEFEEKLDTLTKKGLRVVGVGYKEARSEKREAKNLIEEAKDFVFVGFIGLKDPLRKEAKQVIKICRGAGMKPIIVTGDHLLTAKAVAKELGFKVGKENMIEGKDLDNLTDEEFQEKVKDIQVFARVEPEHKLRIIDAWQKRGEVVAMTGDGINDAPALKKADIGVALGSGTDVAKEVSDLILLTDNFNILVAAIEEGRAIIDNMRKVITYLLSDSFTEVILIGVSLIFGWPLPIVAAQILWVNLIEDGPLGLCLAFEPKEKDVMKQKPQGHRFSLITKEMKVLIVIIGVITDLLLLGLFFWLLRYSGYEILHIRSVIFAGLTIDSIFYVFSCKSLRKNIWHTNPFSNKFLIGAWLFGVVMLLMALYFPPLQMLLKTVPLNLFDWQLIIGLGLLNIALIEATKWYFITKSSKQILK